MPRAHTVAHKRLPPPPNTHTHTRTHTQPHLPLALALLLALLREALDQPLRLCEDRAGRLCLGERERLDLR
jgi:hypothetical protein